jgi:hypothetical protein
MTGGGEAANTLAGQQQADTETQLGLERRISISSAASPRRDQSRLLESALWARSPAAQSTAMNVAGAFGVHPLTAAAAGRADDAAGRHPDRHRR